MPWAGWVKFADSKSCLELARCICIGICQEYAITDWSKWNPMQDDWR